MDFCNGDTSIWYVDWSGLGPLCTLVPFVHISDTQRSVKELWNNGTWDVSSLSTHIPEELLSHICSLPVPLHCSDGLDRWSWSTSVDKNYSAKSAYSWLQNQWRNNFMFNFEKWDVYYIVRRILTMTDVEGDLDSHNEHITSLWWSPPPAGYVKLNVDGNFCNESKAMYTGGVLRDADGGWLCGFSSQECAGSVLMAELLAVLRGLVFAWNRGEKKLLCEFDSLEVLHLLRAVLSSTVKGLAEIVAEINNLLNLDWDVQLHHVFREGNSAADFLAKCARTASEKFVSWLRPPVDLQPLLLEDSFFLVN
ncbi:Ribonuclease H domain [Sesbania bispinosa]|nr:Ribonuclease H domain [Sesbania bispinosa]